MTSLQAAEEMADWLAWLERTSLRLGAVEPVDADDVLNLDHWLYLVSLIVDGLDADAQRCALELTVPLRQWRDSALESPVIDTACELWAREQGIELRDDDMVVELIAVLGPWGRMSDEPALTVLHERYTRWAEAPWQRAVLCGPRWVRRVFEQAAGFEVEHAAEQIEIDAARYEIAASLWREHEAGPHARFPDALAAATALLQ